MIDFLKFIYEKLFTVWFLLYVIIAYFLLRSEKKYKHKKE